MRTDAGQPPIRVLHVIESLGTGGMENGVVNLINGHSRDKVLAEVLCTRELGEFAARISPEKLHFDPAVGDGIASAIRAVFGVCRKRRFDIVHSHSWATLVPGYFGAWLSGTPRFVHGEHGTLFLDRPRRRLIQRMIFARADRCLTVSNALLKEISSVLGIQATNFSVIRNGVDIEKFRPDSRARESLLRSIDARDDAVIIGSVGRLVPVKDYPTLLRAFAMLVDSSDMDCHLVLVGDGPDREQLESLATEMSITSQVHFLGTRTAVHGILPAFDIFVLPSVHEGMSNTLLEAAACGVVAVASDIEPNREVVVDGHTGLFFPAGDANALFETLLKLKSDDDRHRTMCAASLSLAQHELSIGNMIRNYEALYCSLFDAPVSGNA